MSQRYDPIAGAVVLALLATTSLNAQGRVQRPIRPAAAVARRGTSRRHAARRATSTSRHPKARGCPPIFRPIARGLSFDLLGHVYRMPSAGGTATALTQNSGVALNFQPRISPDGKTIAFISDRRGQYNLWVMNADGSNQRPVFTDLNATALEPAWTPDGNYIVVRKGGRGGGGEGGAPAGGMWMYHKDGGQGVQIDRRGCRSRWRRWRQRHTIVAERVGRWKVLVLPGWYDGRRQGAAVWLDATSPV